MGDILRKTLLVATSSFVVGVVLAVGVLAVVSPSQAVSKNRSICVDKQTKELKLRKSCRATETFFSSTSVLQRGGKSAYETWLELGNTGTKQDFIDSLVGPSGASGRTKANKVALYHRNGPSPQWDVQEVRNFYDEHPSSFEEKIGSNQPFLTVTLKANAFYRAEYFYRGVERMFVGGDSSQPMRVRCAFTRGARSGETLTYGSRTSNMWYEYEGGPLPDDLFDLRPRKFDALWPESTQLDIALEDYIFTGVDGKLHVDCLAEQQEGAEFVVQYGRDTLFLEEVTDIPINVFYTED